MHDKDSSPRIMRRLTTLFPSEFLEEHAEELGVVERDRKLQIPAFVWAFVFGFRRGDNRNECVLGIMSKDHFDSRDRLQGLLLGLRLDRTRSLPVDTRFVPVPSYWFSGLRLRLGSQQLQSG